MSFVYCLDGSYKKWLNRILLCGIRTDRRLRFCLWTVYPAHDVIAVSYHPRRSPRTRLLNRQAHEDQCDGKAQGQEDIQTR